MLTATTRSTAWQRTMTRCQWVWQARYNSYRTPFCPPSQSAHSTGRRTRRDCVCALHSTRCSVFSLSHGSNSSDGKLLVSGTMSFIYYFCSGFPQPNALPTDVICIAKTLDGLILNKLEDFINYWLSAVQRLSFVPMLPGSRGVYCDLAESASSVITWSLLKTCGVKVELSELIVNKQMVQ